MAAPEVTEMLMERQQYEVNLLEQGIQEKVVRKMVVSYELGQLDAMEDAIAKRKAYDKNCAEAYEKAWQGEAGPGDAEICGEEPPPAGSLFESAMLAGAVYGLGSFALEMIPYIEGRNTMSAALRKSAKSAVHGAGTHVVLHYTDVISNSIFGSSATSAAKMGFYLVAADFSKAAMDAIDAWISHQISGSECAQRLGIKFSTSAITALSIDGVSRAGQYYFGTAGSVIGGVFGFLLGSKIGDAFARWLFGVESPEEALAAAYTFLGVTRESSDREVRIAYLRRSLELHPDHNNNSQEANENMIRLNTAYHMIRASRGQA